MTQPATGLSGQLGLVEETFTSAQQTITVTGSPTGGSFTLTYNGQTTAAIAWNAAASAVASALQALANVGATGVTAAGGALPATPVVVTFAGPLAGQAQPLMTAVSNLTGGSTPVATPSSTVTGKGYGSGGTPVRFLPIEPNDSISQSIQDIESQAMIAGNIVQRSNSFQLNRKGASGDQTFEFSAIGMGMLLKHMLGVAPTIATPTNGVLTRTHTYNGPADPTGMSLCWQKGVPSVKGVVTPFTYVGGKVTAWELSQDLDAFLQLKLTMDFQDVNTSTALAAASYPANIYTSELTFLGGTINVNGGLVPVTKWSVACNHNLNTDRYFVAGSALKAEPLRKGYAEITGSLDVEFNDLALYNAWVSGSLATVTLNYAGNVIESVSPTYQYGLAITLGLGNNVRFDGDDPALSTMDVIPQTIPIKVLNDGTNPPIRMVVTTTDTAY